MEGPGPEDDLEMTTRDVVINERGIWSDAAVEMRLGPHLASGRTLEVRFLSSATGKHTSAPDVEGVQWIQLLHDVRLVLTQDRESSYAALGVPDGEPAAIGSERGGQIELTSSGPLFVDVPQRVAEFDRDVEVFFIHSSGPSDRLACENLLVEFADHRDQTPRAAHGAPSEQSLELQSGGTAGGSSRHAADSGRGAFEPVRLVASGRPVTVTSTLRQFHARCRRLVYDIPQRQISFEALPPEDTAQSASPVDAVRLAQAVDQIDQHCDLQFRQHRLIAPRIEYTWDQKGPRGRLGTLRISGAGRLSGAEDRGGSVRRFTALWHEGLQLIRQNDEPVLSLFGRPELEGAGIGRLVADELHVWLRESLIEGDAAADGSTRQSQDDAYGGMNADVVPDRLLARHDVEIESPQLSARVGQLQAWLVAADGADLGSPAEGRSFDRPEARGQMLGLTPGNTPRADNSHYVECDHLQIRAVLPQSDSGGKLGGAFVTHLTLTGAVLLEERRQAEDRNPSVRVEADRLEAADIHTAKAHVSALGRPVAVFAQGKTLRGNEIHFDQAANRFSVPTPGDLSLAVDHDLESRPLANPLPLTVTWQGSLHFDGKEAVLEDDVQVSTPQERLRAQKLVAVLGAPVRLAGLQIDGPVDFATLECTGDVMLDRRVFDAGGLASQEHAEVPNLTIERARNRIVAAGPGWLRSVSLGSADPLSGTTLPGQSASLTSAAANQRPTEPHRRPVAGSGAPAADSKGSELVYLRVDFQRAMQGNLDTRDVLFEGQVRCVRGPVASWDDAIHVEGLAKFPADTFALDSATLRVARPQAQGSKWDEMEAEGNVEIEGGLGENGIFIARGARLTYDERKDLLILDGGGGMAELVHEKSLGGDAYQMRQRTIAVSPRRKYIHSSGFSQSSGSF
jgi:hypothetical protein